MGIERKQLCEEVYTDTQGVKFDCVKIQLHETHLARGSSHEKKKLVKLPPKLSTNAGAVDSGRKNRKCMVPTILVVSFA